MQIEIRLDSEYREPKILILTDKMTEEIEAVVKKLSETPPRVLTGFKGDALEILEPRDIVRVFSASGKVFAETEKGEYTLRMRLYELEDSLEGHGFVRISNTEIINLKKVRNFDLSLSGTICVRLLNGTVTYASRRYVPQIKRVLGI